MKPKRRQTLFIHLTLLAYLVAGVVNLNEVVLCFGDDGHVAVERATLGGRCESAPAQPASPLTWTTADDASECHCGPCVDVALASIDALPTRVLSLQDVTPPFQFAALKASPFLLPTGPSPTKRLLTFTPPTPSVALASLRSVILLI